MLNYQRVCWLWPRKSESQSAWWTDAKPSVIPNSTLLNALPWLKSSPFISRFQLVDQIGLIYLIRWRSIGINSLIYHIWLWNPEAIAFLHSNQAFSSSCSGNSQGTRKSSWMVNTDKPPIFLGMVYINHLLFLVKLRLVSYCFTNING